MARPKQQPAERVATWPLDRIVPYERNARTHGDEQIELLSSLMQRYGVDQPIVVDEKGVILKGHGRRLAAIKAGFETYPVVVIRGLSNDDKRALRIADNQVALLAGWDDELLKFEVGELQLAGYDIPLLGFSEDDLFKFMGPNSGETDPDEAPEPPKTPISRPGDLWKLGKHRLVCGDATKADDVAKALGGAKPHLMVTDPPYGVQYNPKWRNELGGTRRNDYMLASNDTELAWASVWKLFGGDVAYIWHGDKQRLPLQIAIEDIGFEFRQEIIWFKEVWPFSRAAWAYQHEACLYAVRKGRDARWRGKQSNDAHDETTVWTARPVGSAFGRSKANEAKEDSVTVHAAQKPVILIKRPIEHHEGDVFEPFSGSGTTIIAAEMTNRACHAIEIDPAYCDVAVERWQNFTGGKAVRNGTDKRCRSSGKVKRNELVRS